MTKIDRNYIRLREAIKKCDRQTAIKLILQNVKVNSVGTRSHSPLHWAIIQFDDLDIMTMLLDRGAKIHLKNHRNQTPLDIAILQKKTKAASLLIEKGALEREDLFELLIKAIEKQSDEIVKIIIDYGLKDNPSVDLKKPLQFAISKRLTKIIEHIIPHCSSLEPSERCIPSDLVKGCDYNNNKDCVELLLKWNFTIDPNTELDNKFIFSAIKDGNLPIVLQILERGIDVHSIDPESGLNPLQMACFYKHAEIAEHFIIHNNADINVLTPPANQMSPSQWYFYRNSPLGKFSDDLERKTCIHIAVYNDDPMMVRILLKYGIEIADDPKFFKITVLAVKHNREEIVKIFLEHGSVNVLDTDSEGKTLLHHCVFSSSDVPRYPIAKMLLDRGADIYVLVPKSSLLFDAIENNHQKIAQLFLDNHGDVHYINSNGNTSLHMAMANDFKIDFIKTLLQKGVNPNATNNRGKTPLHILCEPYYNTSNFRLVLRTDVIEKIELLLKYNAKIDAVDATGRTPLFSACDSGNLEAVKYLINNKANVHHTDLEKLNILYITVMRSYQKSSSQIMEILLNHKINVHCMNRARKSLIHVAVENWDVKLIKRLARMQINFNSINEDGNAPLHIAVERESLDLTTTLIKYGANVNTVNKRKKTALQIALKTIDLMQTKLTKHREYVERGESYSGSSEGSDYSSEDDMREINNCKKIIQVLKIQIIKLKAAGLHVNKRNYDEVYHSQIDRSDYSPFSDPQDYYYIDCRINILQLEVECATEMERMRMENIGFSNLTFYDLLTTNIHRLSHFVKNKRIQDILELSIYDEKFPLYMDIIRNRFRDAEFRYRLVYAAKKYFSKHVRRVPDNCIDNVLSHLNIKEIKMFIRAYKPSN